jgi:hypothetical protein
MIPLDTKVTWEHSTMSPTRRGIIRALVVAGASAKTTLKEVGYTKGHQIGRDISKRDRYGIEIKRFNVDGTPLQSHFVCANRSLVEKHNTDKVS